MHRGRPRSFPALEALLDAYFHQDFALEGDLDDIMARYRVEAPAAERARLRAEIARFLARHPRDADTAFAHLPGAIVDPAGWDMDAAAWLRRISDLA